MRYGKSRVDEGDRTLFGGLCHHRQPPGPYRVVARMCGPPSGAALSPIN